MKTYYFFVVISSFLFSIFSFAIDREGMEKLHSQESWWEAFLALEEGNLRFVQDKRDFINQDKKAFESLVEGQAPPYAVVTCSDSRIVPEYLFDQSFGKIFAIRVAGHVVSDEVIASVLYSIEKLGVKLVLVLGHESCGAIQATVQHHAQSGLKAGAGVYQSLVQPIGHHIVKCLPGNLKDPYCREPCQAHVDGVMAKLAEVPAIRKVLDSKKLAIVGGILNFRKEKAGQVEFWQ